MEKMKEVKEEIKKEIKEEKILIIAMGIAIFGIMLFGAGGVLISRILIGFISVLLAVAAVTGYIALYSFVYISGKRAEIEREKEREIERKN